MGAALKARLDDGRLHRVITCENASKLSERLRDAIGLSNVLVSEATVFYTTIEAEGADISSEAYPYLQFDAELLDAGYIPPAPSIKPVVGFGNFLTRKLYTYNAASCVIAYMGWLYGYTDYGEAANDERIVALLANVGGLAEGSALSLRIMDYYKNFKEEFNK